MHDPQHPQMEGDVKKTATANWDIPSCVVSDVRTSWRKTSARGLGHTIRVHPLGTRCRRPSGGQLLDSPARDSLDDVALHEDEDDNKRECRHDGKGHDRIPLDGVLAEELSKANGDRCPCWSASQD
jgi:hypothetical protein